MRIKYTIDPKTPSDFVPSLEIATQLLEDEIGTSANRVEASWNYYLDQQSRPYFNLFVHDRRYGGKLNHIFNPGDFQTKDQLQREFRSIWSEVLQESATLQRQKVEGLLEKYLAEVENGQD